MNKSKGKNFPKLILNRLQRTKDYVINKTDTLSKMIRRRWENTKIQLTDLIRARGKQIATISTIFALLGLLIYSFYVISPFSTLPIDIFTKYMGRVYALNVAIGILISASIAYALYLLIFFVHGLLKKQINRWFWGTILLMIFLVYAGTYFIDNELGVSSNLSLVLRNQDGSLYALEGITCNGQKEIPVIGDDISCNVLPKLTNMNTTINFSFKNGTVQTINNLTFKAPDQLERVCFMIQGIDPTGSRKSLSVCNSYHFFTGEQYQSKRQLFLTFAGGLSAIIFLSVPYVILNLRKLWDISKEH